MTNPPFSLFREYVAQLMKYNKKFLIIGNGNAVTYKEIFPLIKNNEMWLGASKGMGGKAMEFVVPAELYDASKGSVNRIENGKCYVGVMMCTWFTNLDHKKRHESLDLYKKYNAEDFPKYDNYDAIEVSKTCDIPMDYDGVMGVPITFLDKYCPEQFEILGCTANPEGCDVKKQPRSEFAKECIASGRLLGSKCAGGNSNLVKEGNYMRVLYHRILIRKK